MTGAFPADGPNRITILQGEAHASASADVVFATVLGSCISTCLYDPLVGVGGMNHFLLSEPPGGQGSDKVDVHYGAYLMEVLINEMLAAGAAKDRLRAHLYGGANFWAGMTAIGEENAKFARRFLMTERIAIARVDVGGNKARRVEFRPATGQVRCRIVTEGEAPSQLPRQRPARTSGKVELF